VRRAFLVLGAVGLAFLAGCQSDAGPVVVIETSMGNIKVELNERDAPITVKNFLRYVDAKGYDDTIFHRVIKNFMIQGGGMGPDGKPKNQLDPIKNEAYNGLANERGTIAMARTSDPDSATNQFFINVKDNKNLDYKGGKGGEGYCVFGKVIEGMEVVDRIRQVPTDSNDQPVETVLIKSVRRVEPK